TTDEVRAVTDETEFAVLCRHFDIEAAGEMHHNPRKNVLWVSQSIAEIATTLKIEPAVVTRALQTGRQKLRMARDKRETPFIDTTRYTGWNAMMASAMFGAAALLDRPECERHALLTLQRIFNESVALDGAGGVRHSPGGVGGLLEDQVQLANA